MRTTGGVFGSETGTNALDSLWIRPRLSRAISRIVLKMTLEPSGRTCERSTLTTPLNGMLGMGVTKMSWAAAAGVAIARPGEPAGRKRASRMASASEPSSDATSRKSTQIAPAWQEIWAQAGLGPALTSAIAMALTTTESPNHLASRPLHGGWTETACEEVIEGNRRADHLNPQILPGVDDPELSNVSSGHTEARWKIERGRVRNAARDGSFDVRCPREFPGIGGTCQNFPAGCCGESWRG